MNQNRKIHFVKKILRENELLESTVHILPLFLLYSMLYKVILVVWPMAIVRTAGLELSPIWPMAV